MSEPKKIKGQLPYHAYLTLKKEAENERIRISAVLLRLVETAVKGPRIYGWRHIKYAEEKRSDSPNAVQFVANDRLQRQFDYFKRSNNVQNDSVAIRAIVLKYCEEKREQEREVVESGQPRLF